jgi:hypothetical protein
MHKTPVPMRAHHEIAIRCYTHKELAALYNVSWKTLQKWVKKIEGIIGEKHGHFYSAKQVGMIFEVYGYPMNLN